MCLHRELIDPATVQEEHMQRHFTTAGNGEKMCFVPLQLQLIQLILLKTHIL